MPKLSAGFSVIWILVIILLSTFPLIKITSNWQNSISRPYEEKFLADGTKLAYSGLNNPDNWQTHTNEKFNYQIKYPHDWFIKTSYETNDSNVLSRERVISDKIDITVSVYKKFDQKDKKSKIKVENKNFYFYKNKIDRKAVVIEKDNLYYVIDFSQLNYFPTDAQFKEMFTLILRNFDFLS